MSSHFSTKITEGKYRVVEEIGTAEACRIFADREVRLFERTGTGMVFPAVPQHELDEYYRLEYAPMRARRRMLLALKTWMKMAATRLPARLRSRLVEPRYAVPRLMRRGGTNIARAISQRDYILQFVEAGDMSCAIDLGAGKGALLNVVKDSLDVDWIDAVEPSSQRSVDIFLAGAARRIYSTTEECEGEYDLVMSSHSLEHVADLDDTLLEIDRILAPNGVFFIEVPNANDGYYRHRGFVEPHTYYLSRRSMEAIAAAMSWEVVDLSEWGQSWDEAVNHRDDAYFENPAGKYLRALLRKVQAPPTGAGAVPDTVS